MDGVGGTIKRVVFTHVKSRKVVINSPEEFAIEAGKAVPSIRCIFLSEEHEIIEPSFVRCAPYIKGTLNIHGVKRSFDAQGICYLEFFKLSSGEECFHRQYYPKGGDLVCDHVKSHEIDENTCGLCFKLYGVDSRFAWWHQLAITVVHWV